MNRIIAYAVVAVLLVIGAVVYFTGTSESPETTETAAPTETPVPDAEEPVGAVPERQQAPGVVYDENGIAIGGVESRPSGTPLNIDNIIEYHENHRFTSNDGRDTFSVPLPGDPEWADYLEFRRAFPSMNDNSPGYALAYDPEWRSVLRGYREVPEPGMELFGGSDSLRGLVELVLEAVSEENRQAMLDLALRIEEFEIICWPSFPQARPFTLSLWEDAWRFQYANYAGGIREAMDEAGGVPLTLDSIAYGEIEDFQHFQLFNGVTIRAVREDTGETLEFDWLDSIVERNGVYKVFLYKN